MQRSEEVRRRSSVQLLWMVAIAMLVSFSAAAHINSFATS